MKIFISYRRADSKYVVDRIRDRLITAYGQQSVFRDIESIPLGTDFRTILEGETNSCDVMLVVIGTQWANITDSEGKKRLFDPNDFTRIEIETGLKHEGILVIPVLVMGAAMPAPQDLPESLNGLLYRNAINVRNDPDFENDIQRLMVGINQSQDGTAEESIPLYYFEPETIVVLQGTFWMGSIEEDSIPKHEIPQHEVFLPTYRIGKFPVTNKQYEKFISETGKPVSPSMGWDGQKVPQGIENSPVVGVTFFDAIAYCEWLGEKTKRKYTLPNEAQWEKACRGKDKRIYPWGNEFDQTRCNYKRPQISSVDAYPAQSIYGCFDFVGNIRQWTCSLWGEKRITPDLKFAYPWKDDQRNDLNASRQIRRVVRGSSMKDELILLRCSARSGQVPEDPGLPGVRHSFRVVLNV
jgi:formylglycine-generating enzyme required for sulfatase activity